MHRSTVALLSFFFAFTAAQSLTNPPPGVSSGGSQQMLMDLLKSFSNAASTNPAASTSGTSTTTNNNMASLMDLMAPTTTTTGGGSSSNAGMSGMGLNSLFSNPLLLPMLGGDMMKRAAWLSMANSPLPGSSMATRVALLRGGFGDYMRSYMADNLINRLSQTSNLDPTMLTFLMPQDMLPDGYFTRKLFFSNPFFGGMQQQQQQQQQQGSSGSGTGLGSFNGLLPAMFLGGMGN